VSGRKTLRLPARLCLRLPTRSDRDGAELPSPAALGSHVESPCRNPPHTEMILWWGAVSVCLSVCLCLYARLLL